MKRVVTISQHDEFLMGLKGTEEFDNLDELADPQEQPRRPLRRSNKEVAALFEILDAIEAGKEPIR